MLTGQNGVLTKAEEAVEKNKYGEAEEKVKLAVVASFDESTILNKELLKENLNNVVGLNPKVEEVAFDLTVCVDGYFFTITETGEIKLGQDGEGFRPIITHKLTPEEGTKAGSIDIKVMAQYGETGIHSIQKPDGTIENSDVVTYTVTENGDYKFIVFDSNGKNTEYVVSVNNIQSRLDLLGGKDGYNIEFILSSGPGGSPTLNVENDKIHFKSNGNESQYGRCDFNNYI